MCVCVCNISLHYNQNRPYRPRKKKKYSNSMFFIWFSISFVFLMALWCDVFPKNFNHERSIEVGQQIDWFFSLSIFLHILWNKEEYFPCIVCVKMIWTSDTFQKYVDSLKKISILSFQSISILSIFYPYFVVLVCFFYPFCLISLIIQIQFLLSF